MPKFSHAHVFERREKVVVGVTHSWQLCVTSITIFRDAQNLSLLKTGDKCWRHNHKFPKFKFDRDVRLPIAKAISSFLKEVPRA